MKHVRFHKAHGAGNDFVILDGRKGDLQPPSRRQIRALLDRRRGIGGDGLLFLAARPDLAAVSVRYWNADGSPAAFCGNGARCAAALILGKGPVAEASLLFGRRIYRARRSGPGRIRLGLPVPRLMRIPDPVPPGVDEFWSAEEIRVESAGEDRGLRGKPSAAAWIDSGVPHFILPVPDVEKADIARLAVPVRFWPGPGPRGTNVDLVSEASGEWRVRTWERGVEGETPACGSGLAAAGFYAAFLMGRPLPVRLRSAGGDTFVLDGDPGGKLVWLNGPACIVYSGLMRGGIRPTMGEDRDRRQSNPREPGGR